MQFVQFLPLLSRGRRSAHTERIPDVVFLHAQESKTKRTARTAVRNDGCIETRLLFLVRGDKVNL